MLLFEMIKRLLKNEIMLNALYFDIHEIITIKKFIYYKARIYKQC